MTSIIKVDTIQTSAGGTPTASSLGIGGVGKIGQVVNTSNAMSTTTITSTSSVAISGFTATITPSATSSKIFVLATYSYTQDGYNNGTLAFSQIYRGLTNIKSIVAGGDTGNGDYGHAVVLSAYDSPNTTSAVTYNIHAQVQNSSSQFRPTGNSDTLTLMEILA
jgi:hypothetical protein